MEGVIAQSISQAAAVAASAALAVAAVCDSLVSLVGDEGVQGGAADPGQEEEDEGRACWLGTGVEADGSRVAAPPLRFTLPSNSTVKSIVEVLERLLLLRSQHAGRAPLSRVPDVSKGRKIECSGQSAGHCAYIGLVRACSGDRGGAASAAQELRVVQLLRCVAVLGVVQRLLDDPSLHCVLEAEVDTHDINRYLLRHLSMRVEDSTQYAGRVELDIVGRALGLTVLMLVEEGSHDTGGIVGADWVGSASPELAIIVNTRRQHVYPITLDPACARPLSYPRVLGVLRKAHGAVMRSLSTDAGRALSWHGVAEEVGAVLAAQRP